MKNLAKTLLALTVILCIGLSGCSKEGCTDPAATNYDPDANKDNASCTYDNFETTLEDGATLPSEVGSGETLILSADFTFNLTGAMRVKDGGTLKIGEGVTIIAQGTSAASLFIAIEQGGKIHAVGTDAKPIVMTAEVKQREAWGGLIVAGKAPVNVGVTGIAEVGDIIYGGDVADDNSGVIRYVRAEYTGSSINAEKQHNGFSFYGVGSGTTVDHIQAFDGGDDGIEFFGGTVNISYVVSMGNGDDQFDFAEGYSGTVTNLYIEYNSDTTIAQDKGIEGDNLKSDNSATPVSDPTIKNLTIIGYRGGKNADNEPVDGIRIREGAKGTFENVVIKNISDDGIDARSLATLQNINNGSLTFTDLYVENAGDKQVDTKLDDGETDPGTVASDARTALQNDLVTTEPAGADFNSWKGNWVKTF